MLAKSGGYLDFSNKVLDKVFGGLYFGRERRKKGKKCKSGKSGAEGFLRPKVVCSPRGGGFV